MDAAALAPAGRDDVAGLPARGRRRHGAAPRAADRGRHRAGRVRRASCSRSSSTSSSSRSARRSPGRYVRRRRPGLPKVVADDRAGTALIGLVAVVVLAVGLAHHPAVEARARAFDLQAATRAPSCSTAPRSASGGTSGRWTRGSRAPNLYRTCVPGPDARRSFCVFVDTGHAPARGDRATATRARTPCWPGRTIPGGGCGRARALTRARRRAESASARNAASSSLRVTVFPISWRLARIRRRRRCRADWGAARRWHRSRWGSSAAAPRPR